MPSYDISNEIKYCTETNVEVQNEDLSCILYNDTQSSLYDDISDNAIYDDISDFHVGKRDTQCKAAYGLGDEIQNEAIPSVRQKNISMKYNELHLNGDR